ncbi:MAG: RNA polymerase factor sigma-54 [Paraclostridium sp.]
MNFNHRLEINQSQKLVMTTQLKQSLSILNMSKSELEAEIIKESEENPLLDVEKKEDINWEEYAKSMDTYSYKGEVSYNPDNEVNLENMVKSVANIYDHLHLQISLYKLSTKQREVCDYIIDSLDEDGYLRISREEIQNEINIDEDTFEDCLYHIQQLEPSGVGARNLKECLIIQMENQGIYDEKLVSIIEEDLNLIGLNKFKEISKKHNISLQRCVKLINIIKQFDPKPGRLCSDEKISYVQPDVIVDKVDDEFIVYVNERDGFKVRINNFYREVLKNSIEDENAKEFIKNKLNSATGLVKNIESRKNTILKISEEILDIQKDFFEKGPKYIKPLRLKDIAERLEFHESTISRGVNGKYMLTPYGLYEFKYFFSSAIETNDSECASSTSIKKIIKDTIKSENKKKPLSDEQISKILKENGISVARRTVAKYREELGIASSSKRKLY